MPTGTNRGAKKIESSVRLITVRSRVVLGAEPHEPSHEGVGETRASSKVEVGPVDTPEEGGVLCGGSGRGRVVVQVDEGRVGVD